MEQYLISKSLLSNIPKLLQAYISKQPKQKDVVNYDEYEAWIIDYEKFLTEELNYSNLLDNPFRTMFSNKDFKLNKPSIFKFEDIHYCIFKNEEAGARMLNKLEKISKIMQDTRNRAQYLIKYHPKQFITKANLIKYNSMDINELNDAINKILPQHLNDISPENICIENLKVDIDLVQTEIVKSLSKNGVKKEYNAIKNFYNHHFFGMTDFSFKVLNRINSKASDLVGDIYKKQWHTLGDTTFMNSLSAELQNYFADTTYATKAFVMSNSDFFLGVRTDIKDELNEMLNNTTASALLFQDTQFKQRYEHYCYISEKVLSNKELESDIARYKEFCSDYSFIPHQKLFVDQVIETFLENNINKISDLSGLKIKDFFSLFDKSKEKECYELFVSDFNSEDTIDDLINSYENGGVDILVPGSRFLSTTNSTAGFFLLLFDSIRIVQGRSNGFDIYKSLFASNKTTDQRFHLKSVFHIYLISNLLFDGELGVYENMLLRNFIDDEFFITNKFCNKITNEENNQRIIKLESLYLNSKNFTTFYKKMREIVSKRPALEA